MSISHSINISGANVNSGTAKSVISGTLPLSLVNNSDKAIVRAIRGKDETKRFLENLGFVVGEEVCIISEMAGNVIINVKGTRVAISKAMTSRIMVDVIWFFGRFRLCEH